MSLSHLSIYRDGPVELFEPDGHAVTVIGWRADGQFIVRDSWGPSQLRPYGEVRLALSLGRKTLPWWT